MYPMVWDKTSCRLTYLTWKITVTKLNLSENTTGSLKKQQFHVFFQIFWLKTHKISLKNVFKWLLLLQYKEKAIISFTFKSPSKQSFSKCSEQTQKFLGSGYFPLIFYSHSSRTLWKLRFWFFVERLVQ